MAMVSLWKIVVVPGNYQLHNLYLFWSIIRQQVHSTKPDNCKYPIIFFSIAILSQVCSPNKCPHLLNSSEYFPMSMLWICLGTDALFKAPLPSSVLFFPNHRIQSIAIDCSTNWEYLDSNHYTVRVRYSRDPFSVEFKKDIVNKQKPY